MNPELQRETQLGANHYPTTTLGPPPSRHVEAIKSNHIYLKSFFVNATNISQRLFSRFVVLKNQQYYSEICVFDKRTIGDNGKFYLKLVKATLITIVMLGHHRRGTMVPCSGAPWTHPWCPIKFPRLIYHSQHPSGARVHSGARLLVPSPQ